MASTYLFSLLTLLFSSTIMEPPENAKVSINYSGTSTIDLDNIKHWGWIIEPKYSHIDFFETKNGFLYLHGFNNKQGLVAYPNVKNWIIEPQFEDVMGRGHVGNYPWIEFTDNNGQYGLVNLKSGKISSWRSNSYPSVYSNYSSISRANGEGVINVFTGEWLFEKRFEGIYGLHTLVDNGMAAAKQNGKWGVIDNKGDWLIRNKFEELDHIDYLVDDGMAAAKQNGKWGVIDKAGNWLIPNQYGYISIWELTNLGMSKTKQNGKSGLIDKTGNWLIPNQFDNIYDIKNLIDHGMTLAKQNGKAGVIDQAGNWLIPNQFEDIDDIKDLIDHGMTTAKQNGKWGVINKKGNWLIQPNFDRLNGIYNLVKHEKAAVKLNEKWGVIDKAGNWIINPVLEYHFSGFEDLSNYGKAVGYQNGKWGVIDKNGNWLITPAFDQIYGDLGDNKNAGYLRAKQKDKWGVIDINGQWLLDPKFDRVNTWDDYHAVQLKEKWGILDRDLNWLINPQFDKLIFLEKQGLFTVMKNNKWGVINESGNYLTENNYIDAHLESNNDFIVLYKASGLLDIYHSPSKKILMQDIALFKKLGPHYLTGWKNNDLLLFDPASTLQKTVPYQNNISNDVPHFKLAPNSKWGLGAFLFNKSRDSKISTVSKQSKKVTLKVSDIEGIMQLMINGEYYDLANGFYDEIEVIIENSPKKLAFTITDYAGNTYNKVVEN